MRTDRKLKLKPAKLKHKPAWKVERDRLRMILEDEPVKVAKRKGREPEPPPLLAHQRNAKLFVAERKINKDINDFKPMVSVMVAIDPEHGRVMVTPERWVDVEAYHNMIVELDGLAHKYCLRMRGVEAIMQAFRCDHPTWMRRNLKIRLRHRDGWEWHAFCSKCGKDLGRFEPEPAVPPPLPPGPIPKPRRPPLKMVIRKKAS